MNQLVSPLFALSECLYVAIKKEAEEKAEAAKQEHINQWKGELVVSLATVSRSRDLLSS